MSDAKAVISPPTVRSVPLNCKLFDVAVVFVALLYITLLAAPATLFDSVGTNGAIFAVNVPVTSRSLTVNLFPLNCRSASVVVWLVALL